MKAIADDVREKCILLRSEQLSLQEISERTGVSKGTLSTMLRDYPLSRKQKRNAWNKGNRSYQPERSKWADAIALLSPNERGKVAEAAVLFRICVFGMSAYGSPFDGDKADWIVLRENGLTMKVQVKLCRSTRQGRPVIELRSSSAKARYEQKDFDFIIGYDEIEDVCYVFSKEDVAKNRATVTATDESREAWDKIIGE